MAEGACVVGGVHGGGGGMHGRGVCLVGGHGGGACVVGGVHGGGMCGRYYEIRSMSGRYASYWNAFLLTMVLLPVKGNLSKEIVIFRSRISFKCQRMSVFLVKNRHLKCQRISIFLVMAGNRKCKFYSSHTQLIISRGGATQIQKLPIFVRENVLHYVNVGEF